MVRSHGSKKKNHGRAKRPGRAANLAGLAPTHLDALEPRMLFSATSGQDVLTFSDGATAMAGHAPGCTCGGCITITDSYGDRAQLSPMDELMQDLAPPEVGLGFGEIVGVDGGAGDGSQAALSVPVYYSNPGASATLYLDFDGSTTASWGSWSNIVTPAYDIDGDTTSFSAVELSRIQEIWARVAEDFAPFDIDVTTEEPGSFANGVSLRVAIGGSSYDWYGSGAGGVAYINSFTNSIANTVFVFEDQLGNGNARYVAEAASHEAGHGFGLYHQAEWSGNTKVAEYYAGANGWAPIMGVGYYQTQTTWSDGRASNGNMQDDLSVLTNSTNGFGYRADDHGSTNGSATTISLGSGGAFSEAGVVERMTDVDVFRFDVGDGTLSIDLDVASVGANLNAVLKLYDVGGNLLTTSDPTGTLDASLSRAVTEGTYYLHVSNNGQYGALGRYTLAGTAPELGFTGPAEVSVSRNGTAITDGQGSAISFGSVALNAGAPTVTFTVRNIGGDTLNLASLTVPTGFTVTEGLSASLASGESDTFTVAMSTATGGTRSGTISFTTNDSDEPVFNFNVTGSVVAPAEIAVTGPSGNITDGATAPISFGSSLQGAAGTTRTFTVTNTGDQTLNLSSLLVPAGYTVTQGLVSSLAAGQSDTFTVRLNTTTLGTFTGDIRILSNDADEATFNFAITGTVTVEADAYENNDSKAQVDAATAGDANSPNLGRLIQTTTLSGLTLDDSADWFRFEMGGAGGVKNEVRVDFDDALGDLTLTVFASNGSTVIGTSAGTGDVERVSLSGAAAGVYYARVTGAGGDLSPGYTLTINPATSENVFSSGKKVGFTDGQGNKVNVALKGAGAGELILDGNGDVAGLILAGTSKSTVVDLTGSGAIAIDDLTVTDRVGAFNASNLHVTGDVTFAGGVGRIVLGSMSGAAQQTLSVGSGKAVAIVIGEVSDATIDAATTIKSLRVGSWTDAGGGADGVTAARIVRLNTAGDFDADVTLTGAGKAAIDKAKVGGEADGAWNVTGRIGTIAARSTGAGFALNASGRIDRLATGGDLDGDVDVYRIGTLVIGDVLGADINISGANGKGLSVDRLVAGNVLGSSITVHGGIGTLIVDKWTSDAITASWIGSIRATGDFDADLTLTGAVDRAYTLGRVVVGGSLGGATWNIDGAVRSIDAGATDPSFTLNATGPVGAAVVAPRRGTPVEGHAAPLSDEAIAIAAADLDSMLTGDRDSRDASGGSLLDDAMLLVL